MNTAKKNGTGERQIRGPNRDSRFRRNQTLRTCRLKGL